MAVQCLILSSGLRVFGAATGRLLPTEWAPTGVEHAFCLTPTDEGSHSATVVVLCFAIVCVCVCMYARWDGCIQYRQPPFYLALRLVVVPAITNIASTVGWLVLCTGVCGV